MDKEDKIIKLLEELINKVEQINNPKYYVYSTPIESDTYTVIPNQKEQLYYGIKFAEGD